MKKNSEYYDSIVAKIKNQLKRTDKAFTDPIPEPVEPEVKRERLEAIQYFNDKVKEQLGDYLNDNNNDFYTIPKPQPVKSKFSIITQTHDDDTTSVTVSDGFYMTRYSFPSGLARKEETAVQMFTETYSTVRYRTVNLNETVGTREEMRRSEKVKRIQAQVEKAMKDEKTYKAFIEGNGFNIDQVPEFAEVSNIMIENNQLVINTFPKETDDIKSEDE